MNIFGLLLNLFGVVFLFLFGMPFRIATGGTAATWSTSNIDVQVKKIDDLFSVRSPIDDLGSRTSDRLTNAASRSGFPSANRRSNITCWPST